MSQEHNQEKTNAPFIYDTEVNQLYRNGAPYSFPDWEVCIPEGMSVVEFFNSIASSDTTMLEMYPALDFERIKNNITAPKKSTAMSDLVGRFTKDMKSLLERF